MATITISIEGEDVEVAIGLRGVGGIVASAFDGREMRLTEAETKWAWVALGDEWGPRDEDAYDNWVDNETKQMIEEGI